MSDFNLEEAREIYEASRQGVVLMPNSVLIGANFTPLQKAAITLGVAVDEIESLRSRIKFTENILDKLSDEEPGLMSERVNLLLDWWSAVKETQDRQMECPTAEIEEEDGE